MRLVMWGRRDSAAAIADHAAAALNMSGCTTCIESCGGVVTGSKRWPLQQQL